MSVGTVAPVFVLVHSPSLGPGRWRPVADELSRAGHQVVVPLPPVTRPAPGPASSVGAAE